MKRSPMIHALPTALALALAGAVAAQPPAPAAPAATPAAPPVAATAPAPAASPMAVLPEAGAALEAKRAEMARLQEEMTALGRRMGELGRELGEQHRRMALQRVGGGRPGMGVVLGESAGAGVTLRAVTPGGPADKAGLKSGDVVRSIDGRNLDSNGRKAVHELIDALRGRENGQKVSIGYLRDGRSGTTEVTLAPIARTASFDGWMGDAGHAGRHGVRRAFRFRGLSLSSIDADLGRYFGTRNGVLLIRQSDTLPGLKSGDVITAVEGEAVDSPREVMRALGGKDAGEKLKLRILRNRVAQEVEVTVPEGQPLDFLPPPPPPAPPAPPAPPKAVAPLQPPAPVAPPPPPPVGAAGTTI